MDLAENDKSTQPNEEPEPNSGNMDIPTLKSQFHSSDSDCNATYYGVYIPADTQIQDNDGYINVFKDKIEALKIVKKYKKSRFKALQSYDEAAEFAEHGSEYPNNNVEPVTPVVAPPSERANQFRGPKPQDLVKLRKAIEAGDKKLVKFTIWDNPRYLISSGDTPSILHEGARYNALHITAKSLQAEICDMILETISNISFITLLYGDYNIENAQDRSRILLDLYLNTPDKTLHETPIHFAVKFGALEVARSLLSYPQCDRNLRNKFMQTPEQIICSRVADASQKEKIKELFRETFYVPVIRSMDNSTAPVIGEPFSSQQPLKLNVNLLSPRMEIHAYAGPMDRKRAEVFRKKWKTPPRTLFGSPGKLLPCAFNNKAALRFQDAQKGLECLGRDLAYDSNVEWKEYWPFLDCFVNLNSKEGFDALETYFSNRISFKYSIDSDSSDMKIFSPPRRKANSDFTTDFIHLNNSQSSATSPITDLCNAFQACNLNDNVSFKTKPCTPRATYKDFEFISNGQTAESIIGNLCKPDISPFICIEKSCQLFANRILNDILFLIENDSNTTTNILETQMKQLQSLMSSYIDDGRFSSIDFHLVHSRIAALISHKLKYSLKLDVDLGVNIKNNLESWLNNYNKTIDCFSSDDEDIQDYRVQKFSPKKNATKNTVICLIESILKTLSTDLDLLKVDVNTEDECMSAWNSMSPCTCSWDLQIFIKKKNSTKKKNMYKKNNNYNRDTSSFNLTGRQLNFNASGDSIDSLNDLQCLNDSCKSDDESSDDQFYAADAETNLNNKNDSPDEDTFYDAIQADFELFIEGTRPTKTDRAVYQALGQNENVTPQTYPNLYKWRHCVSLFSDEERLRWPNSRHHFNSRLVSSASSTPVRSYLSAGRHNSILGPYSPESTSPFNRNDF